MENYSSDLESKSAFDNFELQFTLPAQAFLRETAKWASFLSILGFIFIGLMVVFGLVMFAAGGAMGSLGGGAGMFGALGGATIGGVYIVIALFYFFPVLYLFRFASSTKQALNTNNTERLTAAMENLKSHYKFLGILAIIMIAIYALVFVFAIVAGVSAASGGM